MEYSKISYGTPQSSLRIGNFTLGCYILENAQYVLSVLDFQKAIGYEGKSQNWFSMLLTDIRKFLPINQELISSFSNPKYFELVTRGEKNLQAAFDARLLKQACNIVCEANIQGFLSVSQVKFARHAQLILEFLRDKNIFDLIDESTGFSLFRERVRLRLQERLYFLTGEPEFLWLHSIPFSFIARFMDTFGQDWKHAGENPEKFDFFLIDVLYSRIPADTIEEMRQARPKRSYKRGGITYRHTLIGFSSFISELMSMLETSGFDRNIFLQLLNRSFPRLRAYHIPNDEKHENLSEELNDFAMTLEKGLSTFRLVSHKK